MSDMKLPEPDWKAVDVAIEVIQSEISKVINEAQAMVDDASNFDMAQLDHLTDHTELAVNQLVELHRMFHAWALCPTHKIRDEFDRRLKARDN
jgi:hypothetical protein